MQQQVSATSSILCVYDNIVVSRAILALHLVTVSLTQFKSLLKTMMLNPLHTLKRFCFILEVAQ